MKIWKFLIPPLKQIYITYGVLNHFREDLNHLEKAFINIEQLWEIQYQSIKKINFVLLGEAPSYGETKSYFYNEHSNYTQFFRYEIFPNVKSTSLEKSDLFIHLRENGFIILDLFPFALNEKNTAINYKKHITRNNALNLFHAISKFYFIPKLRKVKAKATKSIVFSLRYKKNNVLSPSIQNYLELLGLTTDKSNIKCVASGNHPIDMQKLQKQYSNSLSDLEQFLPDDG